MLLLFVARFTFSVPSTRNHLVRCCTCPLLSRSFSPQSSPHGETKPTAFSAASQLGLNPNLNRFHAPIVYHEKYSVDDWPSTHTFPMDKFAKLARALVHNCRKTIPEHSTLRRPVVRSFDDFFRPLDFNDVPLHWFEEPGGPIDSRFFNDFLGGHLTHEECRRIGFREQTSRRELIERTVIEVVGTILSCQLAVKYGIASNAAGGTHHASSDQGAGYTILNDLAISANFVTDSTLNDGTIENVKKVLVVDCDVHQGDGTAKFGGLGGRLATLSIHCQDNYPQVKATSTFDVGLPVQCVDREYMAVLKRSLKLALEETDPDLVLYDAGVDVFEDDKLGMLQISLDGIRKRDRWVLETCVERGIPVAAVIGGGYDADVEALARRHSIVHEECAHVWRKYRMWDR